MLTISYLSGQFFYGPDHLYTLRNSGSLIGVLGTGLHLGLILENRPIPTHALLHNGYVEATGKLCTDEGSEGVSP